jgi:hypothetical protein
MVRLNIPTVQITMYSSFRGTGFHFICRSVSVFQTAWSRVLEKLTVNELVKKFSTFYRSQKFSTLLQEVVTDPIS